MKRLPNLKEKLLSIKFTKSLVFGIIVGSVIAISITVLFIFLLATQGDKLREIQRYACISQVVKKAERFYVDKCRETNPDCEIENIPTEDMEVIVELFEYTKNECEQKYQ